MLIIGIDPGISGSICFFNDGKILDVIEMPTMNDGKKNKKQVNGSQIFNEISKRINTLEKKQIKICSSMQLPMYFVRPAKWKKYYNLINTQKDASRTRAIEIFPYFSSQLSKKKDSNKADAICADFSLVNLFIRADIVVKSVIILLIACSIYSWAVIIEKFRLFKKINISSEEFETKFWNSKSAETFYNNLPANLDDPMALIFKDAMQNLLKRRSKTDLNNRMTTMLETGIEKQMSKISKGFTFLATVGSTAPFIGLFGTVWGIMNSFQSIAISRNTSLAIVAPGIAEALFATALGLLAAIPAVVAYNKFNNDSAKYSQKLENFSKRFLTII